LRAWLAFATSERVHKAVNAAPIVTLVAILIGVALGALLMATLRTRRDQALARERNARGRLGEAQAELLLTAAGYEIVARQQRASYQLRSDDLELRVGLSFDFVVEKAGKQWIAEVKTGALGTQLKHADTRRQLLEYQLASGHAAVLLVDPERARISQVSFPFLQQACEEDAERAPISQPVGAAARVGQWIVCVALGYALCLYLFAR
jgi:hypothetical protein